MLSRALLDASFEYHYTIYRRIPSRYNVEIVRIVKILEIIVNTVNCNCFLYRFQLKTAHVLNESILYQDDQWKLVNVEKFTTREQDLVHRNVLHVIVEHSKALE